jgi:hypothetical protein
VHPCIDECIAGRTFDEIRVDASQSERERKRDPPDPQRDDVGVQREGSFGGVIAVRMVISRPVRLVA